MATPQYIVVNGEAQSSIIDGVYDLCTYLDSKSETSGALESVATDFKKLIEQHQSTTLPPAAQDYFFTIAESASAILNVPPADFESISNLYLFVLSSAPEFETLIPVVLANISNSLPTANAKLVALLAVLGNLFNILPVESTQRASVFDKVLDVSISAKTASQFSSQLPEIAKWLEEWNVDQDQKESIVTKLVNNIPNSKEVANFLISVLKVTENKNVADLLISKILDDELNFDFDEALELPAVQAAEKYPLFKSIAEGDYSSFAKLNVSDENLKAKAQITTLSRLASNSNELLYKDIAEQVSIPVEEVELLVLSATKNGIVKGRMNQLSEKFVVESATIFGPVTENHWNTINQRIDAWRQALK